MKLFIHALSLFIFAVWFERGTAANVPQTPKSLPDNFTFQGIFAGLNNSASVARTQLQNVLAQAYNEAKNCGERVKKLRKHCYDSVIETVIDGARTLNNASEKDLIMVTALAQIDHWTTLKQTRKTAALTAFVAQPLPMQKKVCIWIYQLNRNYRSYLAPTNI